MRLYCFGRETPFVSVASQDADRSNLSFLAQQVEAMIAASALPGQPDLLTCANALLDSLDALLLAEGLITLQSEVS